MKNLSKSELVKKTTEIEENIYSLYNEKEETSGIVDGIINIDEYLKAKYKILWILKEPYGVDGGWSLVDALNEKTSWGEQPKSGRNTYRPMVYATYGIFNDFTLWDQIPSIEDNYVFQYIHKIAYINVKKLPNTNGSRSNPVEIRDAYEKNRELLLEQIRICNPDIIIGGNTLHYFFSDLQVPLKNKKKMGNRAYYPSGNTLFIDAYHPSVPPKYCSERDYVDGVIKATKSWTNKL